MGRKKCLACGHSGYKSDVTYHRFPKNKTVRQRWINLLKIDSVLMTPHSVVCSKHFNETSFVKVGTKTFLNFDATPEPFFEEKCDEWMRALGRPDLQGINADKMHQSKYRVCSVHFHSNSFSSMLMNRLKKEAVPILFPSAAGQGPFFGGGEAVEGDKYITFTAHVAKCGKIRWRCVNRKCPSKIYTADDEITVLEQETHLVHNHMEDSTLKRQQVSNALKRKALVDLTERPANLIHNELMNNEITGEMISSDLECLRRNIYIARRSILPPHPKNQNDVYDTLPNLQPKTYKAEEYYGCRTTDKNGTESSDKNEIIDPANINIPKEKSEDSQTNSDNNDSNDVPSEENTNVEEKEKTEESINEEESNSREKSSNEYKEVIEKPIENGIQEIDDVNETNNVGNESEENNMSRTVLSAALSSQNEDNDDEDDDFNPLLLCPDISMDVDESPMLTSGGAEPIPPSANELMDSNSLFAPLFSTFVDEMTGAEISFNLTAEEQQLREKLYGPNNPIEYSKIHCTACNVHLGSALAGQTNRFVHPLLKVLICKECYHFYTSGEFEKDEDGSELYCRWCGQGGQVLCCTMCEFVFCKKCIRINFGRKKLTEVRDSDDWKCFRCDMSQLKALRAMCVEFFEYVRKATARASASNDPDHINKDLTNCCQAQLKKRLGESEVDQEKEAAGPAVKRMKRRRNDEDDPDYNPFARQQTPEAPPSPVPGTSGAAASMPATVKPLPPLTPKPTAALNEVSFPGQSPSPTVRIGSTILNVKSTTTAVAAAAVQARNSPSFAPRTPNTAIRSSSLLGTRQRQNFTTRTPNQVASPRTPVPNPVTVSSSSIQARANTSKGMPLAPAMKHEWFEKTVRAAARVNSNLSYTLTQLNKAQASASSVEQLAVVHNKLQEILSSSINSLIQIRKNLRTEFIAGIKTIRFPPKPPVDPNDDDVIIVNPTPNVSKVNQSILAGLPQISVKNMKTPTPNRVASNNDTNSTTISTSNNAPSRGYLKVKSFSQLQTVTSECITIPDDDPPSKDDEPVIVGQNTMPQVDKDPLADDPLADSEEIEKIQQEENMIVVETPKREGHTTLVDEENEKNHTTLENKENEKADSNKDEDKSSENESDSVKRDKSKTVEEVEVGENVTENEQAGDTNKEQENNNLEATEVNDEHPATTTNEKEATNTSKDKEASENHEMHDKDESQGEAQKLSNGTLEDGITVKKEPDEVAYNVKDKPSPKIRRMLSVKVNLKKTSYVEDMVKQEPVENGDQ